MSDVSVSKESLQRVKTALREFQTNVETSTGHIKSHAEEIVTNTRSSIKKQQALVESLENKVALLSSEIEQCQAQIICNSNQINSLKDNLADVTSRVSSLDGRIVQLDMQKQRLSASSSSADHCNDNSNQIYAIERQIQSCENQRRQLENQLSSMRNQENSLNCQNAKLHAEKSRMDAALIMTKKELKEACGKSEKMKNAGAAVESSVSNFLSVTQLFRQNAVTANNMSKSGIEKCLSAIDEYEAINLVGGSVLGVSSVYASSSQSNLSQACSNKSSAALERTLFELSVLRNNLELTDGNPEFLQLGGSWSEVRKQLKAMGLGSQYQAHHIPSAASLGVTEVTPLYTSLPTIAIPITEHYQTDSYGGRQHHRHQSFLPDVPRSDSYRNEATSEINHGNFIDVVRNEVYNILDRFGNDYDGGIKRYLDALEVFLRDRGMPTTNLNEGGN